MAHPPLHEIVETLKVTLHLDGGFSEVVGGACGQLGVDPSGLPLLEKAQRCYAVILTREEAAEVRPEEGEPAHAGARAEDRSEEDDESAHTGALPVRRRTSWIPAWEEYTECVPYDGPTYRHERVLFPSDAYGHGALDRPYFLTAIDEGTLCVTDTMHHQ
eukprot:7384211-Prymnesium_polylepis.1